MVETVSQVGDVAHGPLVESRKDQRGGGLLFVEELILIVSFPDKEDAFSCFHTW